jgi:hypothetical protein
MPSQSQWYEIITSEELQQGDLFPTCPVVLTPTTLMSPPVSSEPPSAIAAQVRVYNVIVMSQSCDLVQRKLSLVLVCPYWSLTELEAMDARFKPPRMKEEVRRGNVPAYHMLAACDLAGFEHEIQIVDFRTVFSVPFDFLTELARQRPKRLRLRSPYREHLSQAFARFFMRVGLPADIPPFR